MPLGADALPFEAGYPGRRTDGATADGAMDDAAETKVEPRLLALVGSVGSSGGACGSIIVIGAREDGA